MSGGFPSFFGLGLEDSHIKTFWLLLKVFYRMFFPYYPLAQQKESRTSAAGGPSLLSLYLLVWVSDGLYPDLQKDPKSRTLNSGLTLEI